ncbi:MAG: hypothetical protein KDB88_07680 [Flavobacteriales bacterium]|nr:hypothetical protein [Flavobacteriales bacterium]
MSLLGTALDRFERHKFGIIGTLFLHTVLLFGLAIVQVDMEPAPEDRSEMVVEVLAEPELEQLLEEMERPSSDGAPVTNTVNDLNAPIRNASTRPALDARSQERIADKVMEELMNMEREEFDRLMNERAARGEEVEMPELDPSKWSKENYLEQVRERSRTEGPATVVYDLKDRHHLSLPIPAYLCTGEGRIVITIEVDRQGTVKKATLDGAGSTEAMGCLAEYALDYAQRARFNASATAPSGQQGTITFLFLAQ